MSPVSAETTGRRNAPPLMTVENVDFWYGAKQGLFGINMEIYPGEVLAFMGPSGCGKTTLLRALNRMQDEISGMRMTGRIAFDGEDIMVPELDPVELRRRFGWVAQAPNPFPWPVRENIAYGPRLHGLVDEGPAMDDHVRQCLERAHLWEEVSDRMHTLGIDLSGGQQQRLCIARALSINPQILLMDEPCSAIDPIAASKVEDLIHEMKRDIPVVIITHNMQQARRLADRVAFFHMGRLLDYGPTERVFTQPEHDMARRYVTGTYG